MLREEHMLGELHAYRYRGDNPQYALVISHGIGAHGGIYDIFCTHHAARGVDIWSYSAPGHGKSTTTRPRGQWNMKEWAEASVAYAEHVKRTTGLPVFTLASGEQDPSFPPHVMTMAAKSVAGPVELTIMEGASHQLMLFHTAAFSNLVHDFVRKHI